MDHGLQPSLLAMTRKVHGLWKPSGISTGHTLEVRASLMVSYSMIDAIANGLVGKWHTPDIDMLAKRWVDTGLPQLWVWLPYAVLNFVAPVQLPLVEAEEPERKQRVFDILNVWMLC